MNAETRVKPIPEVKKKEVNELSERMKSSKTILIASCEGLPGGQFHQIKKQLRKKAEMKVVKKNAFIRALKMTEKGAMQQLKDSLSANFVILFSDVDAFALSGLLMENQSTRKARVGESAPEDIEIKEGPTDLLPGPAISELSGVGLKVAVKDGKLEIQKGAVIVKKGGEIDHKAANVMSKLGISPIKVGFIPLAAYDSESETVYTNIKIDKEGTLLELQSLIKKALGFAVNMNYPTKETIIYFISKAAMEEKALAKLSEKGEDVTEKTDETPVDNTGETDETQKDEKEGQ